ncbi:MAG: dTDP-4-dehydrorhamnose 3,5-epimerase [Bacteroidales bacterium]
MEVIQTKIADLIILQPKVFMDDRGYFIETYSEKQWSNAGLKYSFVQDNESKSRKGVLRGLHFQKPPYAQGKIVRVIKGAVMDVAVDLRLDSSTYGEHVCVELTEDNKRQFFLPPGFAHGFVTLQEDTIFAYKVSVPYSPESEACILWNDPDLHIDWKIKDPILSDKDQIGSSFADFKSPFMKNGGKE